MVQLIAEIGQWVVIVMNASTSVGIRDGLQGQACSCQNLLNLNTSDLSLLFRHFGFEAEKEQIVNYLQFVALMSKAEAGGSEEQYQVGLHFAAGDWVQKDLAQAAICFRLAAEQGHAEAQLRFGDCCREGVGVGMDKESALSWYKCAAEQGIAEAQNRVGWCFNNGVGTSKDLSSAVHYFHLAAEQGLAKSQCNLALLFETGEGGVAKDTATAMLWFQKSADQGYVHAQYKVGRSLMYSTSTTDLSRAVDLLRAAAVQGHVEAHYCLGCLYERTQNMPEAIQWYERAAAKNNGASLQNLARLYYDGEEVEQNYQKAVQYIQRAIDLNYKSAHCGMGVCLLYGNGVSKDREEAVRQFRLAENCVQAEYWLGYCYYYGYGTPIDKNEAVRFWKRASEKGDVESVEYLAIAFENRGDLSTAAGYYRQAADKGSAIAQAWMGRSLTLGTGVPRNANESVRYYQMMRNQNHKTFEGVCLHACVIFGGQAEGG